MGSQQLPSFFPILKDVVRLDLVSVPNSRVQLFPNDGKYLCGLGGEGIQPGQFERPHALAIDTQGCLYVADTMNYRIQKFGWK